MNGVLGEGRNTSWPPTNIWLGVSVEDAPRKARIDVLRATVAAVRFLSLEPLLADLGVINLDGVHWVIAGGESKAGARPMHPAWLRSVRDQCVAVGVPFHFKQWGEWIGVDDMERLPLPSPQLADPADYFREHLFRTGDHCEGVHCGATPVYRVGKKAAGRLLDGREWNEFPSEVSR
jgi:protein gp37